MSTLRHVRGICLVALVAAFTLAACGGPVASSSAPGTADTPTPSASIAPGGQASPSGAPSGAPSGTGTVSTSPSPSPRSAGASPSPAAGLVPGPLRSSKITAGAVSAARPWSASRPTGHGRVMAVYLPAPWTGGIGTTIGIDVYLPPGYDGGSARYPVIYEAPYSAGTWERWIGIEGILDGMITRGSIPPVIVIFVSEFGGPYRDSECADAVDGREWFDRFVATDLVSWADAHLRTLATPAARATFGFSQGGYCAAAILSHHPDVFSSALVVSGYFVSGIHSGTTPDAWRPFNNDPAVEKAVSPMTVVPRIPAAVRSRLFYILEADPTQGFYGTQMKEFASVLQAAGVPMALIPSALGHSWTAARTLLPTMLELVAGRMVTLGVIGPAP